MYKAAVGPNGYARRKIQFTIGGWPRIAAIALCPGSGHGRNDSIWPHPTDAVVAAVGDVEAAVRPQGDVGGT